MVAHRSRFILLSVFFIGSLTIIGRRLTFNSQQQTERPSTERPSTERPSTERPSTERPSIERPSTERPSTKRPPIDCQKWENSSEYQNTKLVFQLDYSERFTEEMKKIQFGHCEVNNCEFIQSGNRSLMCLADIVIVEFQYGLVHIIKEERRKFKDKQLWVIWNDEPPWYPWGEITNMYDTVMTYARNSIVLWPFGETLHLPANNGTKPLSNRNYAEGKTKGAFAYVTHCSSDRFNRTKIIMDLSKYIDVDFFEECNGRKPLCPRMDFNCEDTIHAPYRFFFAFENALCQDYITEKFWRRLQSSGYFIPVAVGGLSIDDYNRVAPPDSFIHAFNFSSVHQLGKYLQHLTKDDAAFNRYHEWREHYHINSNVPKSTMCDLCKLANNPDRILSHPHRQVSTEWHNKSSCRSLPDNWY